MVELSLSIVRDDEIGRDTWTEYVATDPELSFLVIAGFDYDIAVWRGGTDLDIGQLHWRSGQIFTHFPSEPLIAKLVNIADCLDAKIQCRDGLVYPKEYPDCAISRKDAYRYVRRVRRIDGSYMPAPSDLRGDIAFGHISEKRYDEALTRLVDFRRAQIRLYPDGRDGWTEYWIGNCYRNLNILSEAEQYYRSALQWGMPAGLGTDEIYRCLVELGVVLLNLGRQVEARACFDYSDKWNTPEL